MVDLDTVGGIPAVMKELFEGGFLHGDCMTCTGKTVAENLASVVTLADRGKQDILLPLAGLSPGA